MSLTQIDLRTEHDHDAEFKFNNESWCVSELYWSKVKYNDFGKVKKITIVVSDNWGVDLFKYTNWRDAKKINMPFVFDEYWKLDKYKRKEAHLNVIHAGMLKIAEKEGWDKGLFTDAYNECLKDNLDYEFLVGKPKLSPNRKFKFGLWCKWDIEIFKLVWVLYDSKGVEIKRQKVLEGAPFEGEFVYYLKWKWLNITTVLIEDNYKHGANRTWEVHVEENE